MSSLAVLLVNLGSPDTTHVSDVRRYLREFLSDERVIDIPALARFFLLNLIILPLRPAKTAKAYESIWTAEGSPLIVHTKNLAEKLAHSAQVRVEYAMRYGNPSIQSVLQKLQSENIQNLHIIPLYPHYAMSSYETAIAECERVIKKLGYSAKVSVQPPFFDNPFYITALAKSYRESVKEKPDHLIFSYHGLPERHIRKTDITRSHCLGSETCCDVKSPAHEKCYRHQVRVTAFLLSQELGISQKDYTVAFQSRLGRDPWLLPNTETLMTKLPGKGIAHLAVISPSFVSDNLETLEEINIRYREIFLASGGKTFTYIPALNTSQAFVDTLTRFCK